MVIGGPPSAAAIAAGSWVTLRGLTAGALGLAFLAGVLTVLSPCVLPLLPTFLGAAASQHRLGPLALAGGLALSFTAIGLFVATIGFAAGLDTGFFAASIGGSLDRGRPRAARAALAGAICARGRAGQQLGRRLCRQFHAGRRGPPIRARAPSRRGVGPCVGPTLGAASVLAAKGENLPQVALTMLAFGIGAALPLLLLGILSREALMRWRSRLMEGGKAGKTASVFLSSSGFSSRPVSDKRLEAILVEASPDWLTQLTTRF